MTRRLESIWAYLGELIVAALLLLALNLLLDTQDLSVWLTQQRASLTTILTTGVASSAIAFGAFFAILTTDFGSKLRLVGEAKAYVIAFAFPLLLFVVSLAVVTLGSSNWGTLYTQLCIFLLLYAALNFITMIKNAIDLAGLWQDVDEARNGKK